MDTFRVDSRDLGSGRKEIRVEGEVDLAVAAPFEAVLEQLPAEEGEVRIDLSACEFIDSTAIAIILRKQRQLEAEGGHLILHGASGQVRRILAVAGLTGGGLGFEEADEILSEGTA